MVRASSMTRAGGLMPAPKNNALAPSSPPRVLRGRASRSHPGFGCGPGRISDPGVWLDKEDPRHAEPSIPYNPRLRCRKQDPRDLINAYGNHTEGVSSYEKFPKAPRLDVNGTASESAARGREYWKHSDEDDEYAWENMSPTLPDKNFGKHSWPVFAKADPSFTVQDKLASLGSHNGSMMKYPDGTRSQSESRPCHQGSNYARDAGKFSYMLPQSTQMKLNPMSHNQGAHRSMFMPGQQCNISDRLLHLPYRPSGSTHLNQRSQEQCIPVAARSPKSHGSTLPPSLAQVSSHSIGQPMNHPGALGHGVDVASILPSSSSYSTPSALYSNTDASLRLHHRPLSPLALASSPASPQNMVSSVSTCPTSGFSGLINSLMEQGLISLEPHAKPQDTLGTEFNMDLVNARNDSVINCLYSGLPRQCATCGLRVKNQEDHSSHMDWHVAKNRTSKGRKEKSSRNWYATTKEWLSVAELVGNDVVLGYLPTELVAEKIEEKEIAVPADDNWNSCSLCGEAFEDFYSDELEEWLYRGAMYLNAPNGYAEGLDRSQLGPIIHVKCKPEDNKCSG